MTPGRRLPGSPGWLADAAAVAALAALTAVLFHSAVFRGRILYERDVHLYFYPYAEVFQRMVRGGTWPLWNPYAAFGTPLLANPQYQILYPPTWLLLVLSPPAYFTLYVVGHTVFSATGLYSLCRCLGLSRLGALTGAALWMTSGPWLSLANLWHHLAAAAWMPWVLLAAERFFEHPAPGRAMVWGAMAAVQLLTGSADMSLLTAAAAGLRLAGRVAAAPGAVRRARLLALSAAGAVVAAALAAAQWVPALDVAASSTRGELAEEVRAFWSVHPLLMLQAILAVPFKELELGPRVAALLFESRDPFLHSLYMGLPAGALVAAAAFDRELRWRRFAVAGLALAVLAALGRYTPVYEALATIVPLFQFVRYPVKAMVLTAFFWSVLAGAGVDACRRDRRPARIAVGAALAGGSAAAGLALVVGAGAQALAEWIDAGATGTLAQALSPAVAPLAASAVLALAVGALMAGRGARPRAWHVALAAACAVGDLLAFHAGLNRTAPPGVLSPTPAALRLLPGRQWSRVYSIDHTVGSRIPEIAQAEPHRLAVFDRGPAPPWLVAAAYRGYPFHALLGAWGIEGSYDPDVQKVYPTHLALLSRLMRAAEGTSAQVRLLQIGSVDRVVSLHPAGLDLLVPLARWPSLFRGAVHVFGVPDPVPRTYVVARAHRAEGAEAVRAVLAEDFDAHEEVVLSFDRFETPPPMALTTPSLRRASSGGPTGGWSRIVSWSADRVRIEAALPESGYVVLVDTYDPGWQATVDGRPAELVRANVAFRAVPVGPGSHRLELVYRPRTLVWALSLSGATAASLVVAASMSRRRGPAARLDPAPGREVPSTAPLA